MKYITLDDLITLMHLAKQSGDKELEDRLFEQYHNDRMEAKKNEID